MANQSESERAELEAEIRRRCEAADLDGAATLAIRGYGPEIFGFISSLHRSEADANDVFAQFCEELWKSLQRFKWDSTLRTWAYTIARRLAFHALRSPIRRANRNLALSQVSAVARIEEQVRSQTAAYLRTSVKTKVAKIREQLDPDDRMLLILRVDKQLPWNDIARVTLESDEPDAEALKRESARLRKRFELVKGKILELGRQEGIGGGD